MTTFEVYKTQQEAIQFVKERFSVLLQQRLNLVEVPAPLLVRKNDGVQDDLNGIEKPVSVKVKAIPNDNFEIVHSLAKWKRLVLGVHGFPAGYGIYTHMLAIRPDEEKLDELHSVCVDQWDWEKVISPDERNLDTLKSTVEQIYCGIKAIHDEVADRFKIARFLPPEITFIHSEELAATFPDKTPKQREEIICQKYGVVFLIGIGGVLSDGKPHDGRAPDYDDWTTKTADGYFGLNGDILVWHPKLQCVCEISSMGIRVDKDALLRQLNIRDCKERLQYDWHKKLMNNELPQTIGGGIGRSRLVMLLLQQKHICEVQESVWAK
jgi:aspartate--ammonia ligase